MKFNPYSIILLFFLLPVVTFSQISDAQVNSFPIPTLSTSFIRMPSRGASQELDAIYYNPAGVLSLRDGFHLKIENLYQNVSQTLLVKNYQQLQSKPEKYPLEVAQPFFPLFYIAYKKNKFALSLFVTPAISGGGASKVSNLPFAEYPIADFTAIAQGIIKFSVDDKHGTNYSDIKYDYDFDFTGLSFSPSFQLNLGYKVNDYISLSAGGRITYSIVNAVGSLSNLRFKNESLGLEMAPGDYIRHLVQEIPVGDPEIGNLLATIADSLPLETVIDARQTNISFNPIIGLNFNWHDRWYIGLKYEHRLPVTLTTSVKDGKDGAGAYVVGKKVRADLPGVFGAGVTFKPNDRLTFAIGHRTIFYKRADLNGREEFFVSNYKEFDMAFEYKLLARLKVSAGGTYRTIRAEPEFYNSVDYLVPALTGGMGIKTELSERISIEAGLLYSHYLKVKYAKDEEIFGGQIPIIVGEEIYQDLEPVLEAFDRKIEYEMTGRAIIASVGVNFWMGSIEENRKGRKNRIYNIRVERKEILQRRIERRDCRPRAPKRWNKRLNRKRSDVRIERRNKRIEQFEDIED